MRLRSFFLLIAADLIALSFFCRPALSNSVTYAFTMDTSSALGTSAYIDMQFSEAAAASGGGVTAYNTTATATVSNFQMVGGTLGNEDPYTTPSPYGGYEAYGDTAGTLRNAVVFSVTGDGSTNEYSQGITFGAALSFDVTFSGQGVTTPICPVNQGGTDCSFPGFLLDFYDANGTFYFTNDPTGSTASGWVVGGVSINPDTTTTPYTNPGPGGGPSDLIIAQVPTMPNAAAPEPATGLLMSGGLAVLAIVSRKRRKA